MPPQIHHQINRPDQEGAGKENQIPPIKNKIYVNFFNDFFAVFPKTKNENHLIVNTLAPQIHHQIMKWGLKRTSNILIKYIKKLYVLKKCFKGFFVVIFKQKMKIISSIFYTTSLTQASNSSFSTFNTLIMQETLFF